MNFEYQNLGSGDFELPSQWRVTNINDVSKINELTIKKGDAPFIIEYIDIASVDKGTILELQRISFDKSPSRARRIVRNNDTLISTVRPNLEHYAFIKTTKTNTIASTGFAVITAKHIHPRYLYYYVTTKPFTEYLSRIAESHTSAYPAINPDVIENAEILVPPLPEQKAIAHILGTLDDKIELNQQMNETLEAIAKAVFKSWFVDFDPVRAKMEGRQPVGMDAATAELFPDSFEESALGLIPRGWRVGKLGDIAINSCRSTKPENTASDTPYIGLEHMPRRSIALSDWGNAEDINSNKYEFHKGEILFGKLRPYFHKIGVAPLDGICSTDILVINCQLPEWFSFVLSTVSTDEFINYTDITSTGTRMPRTNWNDMSKYEISIPSTALAQVFNRSFSLLIEKIILNIFESRTLSTIRDTLLPKLMSGEIRVKEAQTMIEEAV